MQIYGLQRSHVRTIFGWQRYISNQNTVAKCRPPQNVAFAVRKFAQYIVYSRVPQSHDVLFYILCMVLWKIAVNQKMKVKCMILLWFYIITFNLVVQHFIFALCYINLYPLGLYMINYNIYQLLKRPCHNSRASSFYAVIEYSDYEFSFVSFIILSVYFLFISCLIFRFSTVSNTMEKS